jgi:predicted nucleic acid-binding protein
LILLDTSVLVGSFTGLQQSGPRLVGLLNRGERLLVSTLVIYEWLRGREFPAEAAIDFGVQEAALAAKLHRQVRKARDREIDIAIAACAITHEAALWTLNRDDFTDIPGLELASPA